MDNNRNNPLDKADKVVGGHPIIANVCIIVVVAVLGLVIVYLSLGLFTKHGQTDTVPSVINMSYGGAVERLHDSGFKVEIKDSMFLEGVKPGSVVEQFPSAGAVVKPGRKVFLYICAVHPKEVILDPTGSPTQEALKNVSGRTARAQLEELGFRNIRVVYVLGNNANLVVKVLADGKPVMKQQKVPVNAQILLEISDGRIEAIADSLQNSEMIIDARRQQAQGWEEPAQSPDAGAEEYSPEPDESYEEPAGVDF